MEIRRIYDAEAVRQALTLYPTGEVLSDVDAWISDPRAIALSDEDGNIGLFEELTPGVYTGHYFFKVRGKGAKALAIRLLEEVFSEYGAKVVRGLTPLENRAALWMTRHLGFKDYGVIDTEIGPCALFIMTKDEFDKENVNG